MIVYMFVALGLDNQGKRDLRSTLLVLPGKSDLYQDIRQLGAGAELGRYRHLDLNPESPTHGYHLFEHGIVSLKPIHL